MDYYIEIAIKGDKQRPIPRLMSALTVQLHHALVKTKQQIAIAYPKYHLTLGDIVRLHGTQEALDTLGLEWLGDLTSFSQVSDMQKVPDEVSYRNYFRIRPAKQSSKLRAGLKSGHITDSQTYRRKMFAETITAPFIDIPSTSTGQYYRRFVGMMEVEQANSGEFDTFGQSKFATVPHF